MTHELKILPEYFEAVLSRNKSFEIRRDDRDFKVGDTLLLKEYDSIFKVFTGRTAKRKITYITAYAQQEDYIVMAMV